jgi:hypothetical protein
MYSAIVVDLRLLRYSTSPTRVAYEISSTANQHPVLRPPFEAWCAVLSTGYSTPPAPLRALYGPAGALCDVFIPSTKYKVLRNTARQDAMRAKYFVLSA